jgi:hypothetical protein
VFDILTFDTHKFWVHDSPTITQEKEVATKVA